MRQTALRGALDGELQKKKRGGGKSNEPRTVLQQRGGITSHQGWTDLRKSDGMRKKYPTCSRAAGGSTGHGGLLSAEVNLANWVVLLGEEVTEDSRKGG